MGEMLPAMPPSAPAVCASEMAALRSTVSVIHVAATLSAGAGTSELVLALCAALSRRGDFAPVHALAPIPQIVRNGVEIVAHPQVCGLLGRFGFSPSLWRCLRRAQEHAEIVHNHGLWMFPSIVPGLVIREGSRARLVVSPHGMLSPWALKRSKWKKRAAWWLLGQRLTLTRAACFHATAESEAENIRRLGFRQPVAIIPNGIEIPDLPIDRPRRGERRTLLFLGRVHKVKGVDTLLNAWATLAPRHPAWDLEIVGSSDPPGYLDEMRALATRLGLARVSFVGPLYGSAKSEAYWNADVFVLPSHSENFGLVIGEALAHGCPVITTREAPWAGLQTERCGWWIEDSLEALTAALYHAMSLDRRTLAEMGARGRAWMERDFGWDGIARQMSAVYLWLLGKAERPACVIES